MTDDVIDAAEVKRIAKAVSKRYANRCWWADPEDMEQEACIAVIKAHKTWDPQVGVPFVGYATRAANKTVHDFLWRESSPVTGGLHDPEKNIAGVLRAPLPDESPKADDKKPSFVPTSLATVDNTAAQLDDVKWRLSVRRRVRQLAARTTNGDAAVEVLIRGRAPSEVREELGGDVYRATELVRRQVRNDSVSYKLLKKRSRGG